jgi:LacI family repressor for deo operon, udp, cdd, tsx, nupC, and nupG
VQHLFDCGHRNIAHLTSPSRYAKPHERLLGFREAMGRLGLEQRADWVIPGDHSKHAGVAAADRLAAMGERPTAVFCGNDEMAIGLISRLRAHGIECPRDISVVGFDDIEFAPYLTPPLTTMRQPRAEMARVATGMLIDLIEGVPSDGPVHKVLPSELVVRASTARVGE